MGTRYDYDLFVIGAGSGGLAASKRAASYGAKVAIAEGDSVGGTCVIRGCVPKKLMVYASQFSHWYSDAVGYGWDAVDPQFHWDKLLTAVGNEVDRLNQVHIDSLDEAGVELIRGFARFVDSHKVKVGNRTVSAKTILIAAGGEAIKPDRPGMEHAITSRNMFLLTALPQQPQRFLVIGGGYIGVEFAGIMNGLGSEVTQMVRSDGILQGFDQDLRDSVTVGMRNRGVKLFTKVDDKTFEIEKTDSGLKVSIALKKGEDPQTFTFDAILAATGRNPKPVLDLLELDKAGVEIKDDGAIAVTEDSCTSQPHIYAVGDCTDRAALTPVAIAEGRAFADTVFGHKPSAVSHHKIPTAVFSQPEAATVGMTEAEAQEHYGDGVKVYRARFRPMFYSLPKVDEKVMVKLIVEGADERILGMHMVGKDAAEIIQSFAPVLLMNGTKADLDRTMALHPSTAEEFVTLR
ncbi:MAG: glutathione-disulfide reductase [Cyanophyceae cyanobacterium]